MPVVVPVQASRTEKLEAEVCKLRELLSELEFLRSRVDELRAENHLLLDAKHELEDQLASRDRDMRSLVELGKELNRYKQLLQRSTEVPSSTCRFTSSVVFSVIISAKVNVENTGGYNVFVFFCLCVCLCTPVTQHAWRHCYCDVTPRCCCIAAASRLGVTSQEVSLLAMPFIFRGLPLIYSCCHGNGIWPMSDVSGVIYP